MIAVFPFCSMMVFIANGKYNFQNVLKNV